MRRVAIAAFIVAFLAIQIGVPAALLPSPATRFGWQMFARVPPAPSSYDLVLADGRTITVPVTQLLGYPRADLDHGDVLVRHLCHSRPDVVAVRWRPALAETPETQPCA